MPVETWKCLREMFIGGPSSSRLHSAFVPHITMIESRQERVSDAAAGFGGPEGAFAADGGKTAAWIRNLDITLSASRDFAYAFDLDGRFLYANRALLDLWGLSLDRVVGRNFFDLAYPDELAAKLQRQIRQVIETREVLTDETMYTSPSGMVGYYEYIFSAVLAEDGSVEAVGGSTRDITDRKRAEAQLRASEERATHIIESITDGFMTIGRDWRITYINPRAEDIFRPLRKTRANVMGKVFWDEFPDTLGTIFEANFRHAMREGATVAYEAFYPALGSWFDVRAYPWSEGLSLYYLDITDRKRAEEDLERAAVEAVGGAEANAKFRTFFDQGTYFAGVMTIEGMVVEANRICLDACGFTREEVIGKKFWECGWWKPSAVLVEMVREGSVQAAEGRFFRKETPYFIADGSERFVELTLAPVTDDEGRVLFIAATGTDITDHRRLADERERLLAAERSAREEAERASHLKDEFLATLSHELRTPLNAILGWTQILAGNNDENDLAEGLRTIERNARAQARIIEDLLDMSRIISGKVRLDIKQIGLPFIVQAAMETTKHAADAKGVRVQAVLDPLTGPVSGDSNRLQQVFWNLLSNAIKFTPRGGHVLVALERVDSHVEVRVSDTGEGISPEFLPHVFDRFRQADGSSTRPHGGLGLGLSIVKQLIELHGGSVRAESGGLGRGSTFSVALPLVALVSEFKAEADRRDPTLAPRVGELSKIHGQVRGVKVLVVDDEADARALIKRLLEGCHAVVTTAASAGEAVRLMQSELFDVLVSDVGMPGEDGYSLIRRVRALGPERGGNTPAIALTAFARAEDRVTAMTAGFQHHLAKPVEPGELIAMIAGLRSR
jgi:PAS domain S-box-containing protein